MNTNFNFFNSLIISGAIQGIVFALVVLLHKKHKSRSNFFLAQVVLYLSLNNFYFWFIDTKISNNILYYQYLYVPWFLLILPCFYHFVLIYIGNTTEQKNIKYFYFLPFFLSLLINISFYFIFSKQKYNINILYNIEEFISAFYTLFIIYKTFLLIKKYEKETLFYQPHKIKKQTKWLKHLLVFGVFICLIWVVTIGNLNLNIKYLLWLSISFLVYWLGYNGIYYNGIFNQRNEIRKHTIEKNIINNSEKGKQQVEDFKKIIKTEKLYLDPLFNLSLFSKKLNLSESYLSHIFNQNSSVNFSEYINKLRVEKAQELLKNKHFKSYTIVAIGLEAGFNSKSTFYNSFKKEVGTAPTQYRKENLS